MGTDRINFSSAGAVRERETPEIEVFHSIITAGAVKKTILDLRAAARMKGQEADEAFLKHADQRSVQGGAICEEASRWRELARALTEAARKCDVLEDCGE